MKSKYFKIHELVPRVLYELLHEDALWRLLDEDLIKSIDTLKEKFPKGTMTINSYMWNGNREWSGIRTKGSKYYSETSQHSLGNAIDAVFSHYSAEEVRLYVLNNQEEFPLIKRIENKVNWLHIDLKNTGKDGIIMFNP